MAHPGRTDGMLQRRCLPNDGIETEGLLCLDRAPLLDRIASDPARSPQSHRRGGGSRWQGHPRDQCVRGSPHNGGWTQRSRATEPVRAGVGHYAGFLRLHDKRARSLISPRVPRNWRRIPGSDIADGVRSTIDPAQCLTFAARPNLSAEGNPHMSTDRVAAFSIELTRYLDTGGHPLGPMPEFATNPADLVPLYQAMVLTRAFDAKAVAQLTGRLGTFAASLGQEAVGVGAASAMAADDVLVPSFRDQAAQLLRGVTPVELLLYWGGDERGSDFAGPRDDFPIPCTRRKPCATCGRCRIGAEAAS